MNINNNPQHRANLGYNGFAMDNKLFFSSTTGELLPVYYDFLSPGDKVDINTVIKTRTMTLESSAMTDIQENIDWFFVPMQRIYRFFPEFYFGVNDNGTSLANMTDFDGSFPSYNLKDLVQAILDSEGHISYFNDDSTGMERLIQFLGIPLKDLFSYIDRENIHDLATLFLNPMFACAYQTIYADYFRLSDREMVDTESYNLDKYYAGSQLTVAALRKIFKLRHAPLSKDFYTDLQISPLYGVGNPSSLDSVDYAAVNQWLTASQFGINNPSDSPTIGQADEANIVATKLNTSSIRTSFAIEKLLEITRRAGKHYDKQVLAHFGISVPKGIDGEVMHICGSSSSINIGDVISTADTDLAALGKVGGKGYGYSDNGHGKFEAKCHGILMCIYHAKVTPNYDVRGFDRLNCWLNREDFFQPEFDNLGMQPLFCLNTHADLEDSLQNSRYIGWQYRYKELKQKISKCLGAMNGSLDYWTTHRDSPSNDDLDKFLASPSQLDSIMVTPYSPAGTSYDSLFVSDPLIHELYFDIKKASKMSTYGLPEL